MLTLPLDWKKPHRIFVNSMSDLFHENLADGAIDRVFAIMALCPQGVP
jgi:protein gp37